MKAIYELVTAAELEVGDTYTRVGQSEINSVPVSGIRASATEGIFVISLSNGGRDHIRCDRPVFRRIPATEDPRVLRRALEMQQKEMIDACIGNPIEWIIEQAHKDLESEEQE